MPFAYHGISTSTDVGDIKNIEANYCDFPASSIERLVPFTSRAPRRLANGAIREDGYINAELAFEIADRADLNDLMYAVFGGWTVASVERAISLMDESGHYSPYLTWIGKPSFRTARGGTYRLEVVFPLSNLRLQSTTKTANYTVTADDRLIYCNTGSGSITLALPAVATVNPYVMYSAVKTAAGNTLTINPDGSEEIENAATYAVTALNARIDYFSDGVSWWVKQPE